ncbi:MAG: hypothetical protein GWN86_17870, partial [Desulfobacterales bacterium]|nr:hypothetical protein [Desulfobacterales bacterium]
MMLHSQKLREGKYWFKEEDLAEPIDWDYLDSLPERVQVALEVYMEGRVSLGKASEMASLSVREFDEIR